MARPSLARGAERAGRVAPPPIAGYLVCSVGEDRDSARRHAAAIIAFNSSVKTYRATHRVSGFEREAEAIRIAWRAGDFAGMTAAVSEEMIDAIALAGTPEDVRARFAERWEGVYERTLLWPPAFRGNEAIRNAVEAFANNA